MPATKLDECIVSDRDIEVKTIPVEEHIDQELYSLMYKKFFCDQELYTIVDMLQSMFQEENNKKIQIKRLKNKQLEEKLLNRIMPRKHIAIKENVYKLTDDIEVVTIAINPKKNMYNVDMNKIFKNKVTGTCLTVFIPITDKETIGLKTINDHIGTISIIPKSAYCFENTIEMKNMKSDYRRLQMYIRIYYDKI